MSNTVVFHAVQFFPYFVLSDTFVIDYLTVAKRTSLDVQAIFQVSLSFSYQGGKGRIRPFLASGDEKQCGLDKTCF